MLTRLGRTAARPLLAALLAFHCSGSQAAEEPDYTTVRESEPFAIRDYPALVIARTAMKSGEDQAFRRLFGYISGANQGSRKIAMTAPVLEQGGTRIAMTAPVLTESGTDEAADAKHGNTREMAFILPSEYGADAAPIPSDPEVRLSTIPARRVAVITFSGRAEDSDFADAEAKLRGWMDKSGFEATGPAERAQYDRPSTPGPERRNEVIIPIEE